MRYVNARLEDFQREETYRIYMAKSLQLIPQQQYIADSYFNMMYNTGVAEQNGEEIAVDVIKKAGLRFQ